MNSLQLNIPPKWLEVNFGIIGISKEIDTNQMFIYINKQKYKIVISKKQDLDKVIWSGWI
jgi:hypothetical protein